MQATTCFQDGIANTLRQEADLVFDQPGSFPPTAGLFDTDADGSDRPIGRLLQWGAFTPTRCLLRLDDRDPRARQTLEPRLLIAITPDGGEPVRSARLVSGALPSEVSLQKHR